MAILSMGSSAIFAYTLMRKPPFRVQKFTVLAEISAVLVENRASTADFSAMGVCFWCSCGGLRWFVSPISLRGDEICYSLFIYIGLCLLLGDREMTEVAWVKKFFSGACVLVWVQNFDESAGLW